MHLKAPDHDEEEEALKLLFLFELIRHGCVQGMLELVNDIYT